MPDVTRPCHRLPSTTVPWGATPAGVAAANANGVFTFSMIVSPPVRIGGTAAAARNVLSGNTGCGLNLERPATVQGNLIGTNPAGSAALGNGSAGICLSGDNGSLHAAIGGTTVGTGNVISGNGGDGVQLVNDSGSTVAGNEIGTNARGMAALANAGDGIHVESSNNGETLGGTTTGARNVISGNKGHGIELHGGTGNVVEGNWIGLSAAGAALGNAGSGIYLHSNPDFGAGETRDVIGGTTAGARNVIGGNQGNGLDLQDSTNETVEGNYIGTTPSGTAALPNTNDGILVQGSQDETIGGTASGAGNLISGNKANGLELEGGKGNVVVGNTVGLSAASAALGNAGNGVYLHADPSTGTGETGDGIGNTTTPSAANIIEDNGGNAVLVGSSNLDSGTVGISVRGNVIVNNPLGISLNTEYPSSCPSGPSTGPNDFLPCPVITAASSQSGVSGTAYPGSTIDVYVAAPVSGDAGHGEAVTYVGFTFADSTGHWFLALTPGQLVSGQQVTATATSTGPSNVANETSEFSANATVS